MQSPKGDIHAQYAISQREHELDIKVWSAAYKVYTSVFVSINHVSVNPRADLMLTPK